MMSTLIDTRWDSNVRPLFSDLVQVLDPDSFLNRLYSARLVTKGEYNHLLSMSSREDKSRELLNDILPRKGPNSYDRFVAILRETEGQEHVAKALEGLSAPLDSSSRVITVSSGNQRYQRFTAKRHRAAFQSQSMLSMNNEIETGSERFVPRHTKEDFVSLKSLDNVVKSYAAEEKQHWMPELLWWLCRHGMYTLCTEALEKESSKTLDQGKMAGVTCIHMMVHWGHTHLIPLFHEHGFDLNYGDENSLSPLFWCYASDNKSTAEAAQCAKILRRHGANEEEATPYAGINELVHELIRDPNKASDSCAETQDTLQLLEKKEEDTGKLKKDLKFLKNYWLWKFSRKEDPESVEFCKRLLEEKGANPNACMYVTSAFHRTARFGNKNLLTYLLENPKFSTAVNRADKLDWTSLHNAALFGEKDCAELLLLNYADPDIESRDGMAIDIAREYNRKNVVKLLEDWQEDVAPRTKRPKS
ncbi:ankyrin-1-like isoform X2 [Oscarella lobularis]|uniref:ankyrin-1-like isoform X2 n=1 Tax=Oscarella lobularis TaxID=121494 RepID=UPI003313C4BA